MDINGAKALKLRLGAKAADVPPPASDDVPEGAPPVYRWLGVSWPQRETPLGVGDDDASATAG